MYEVIDIRLCQERTSKGASVQEVCYVRYGPTIYNSILSADRRKATTANENGDVLGVGVSAEPKQNTLLCLRCPENPQTFMGPSNSGVKNTVCHVIIIGIGSYHLDISANSLKPNCLSRAWSNQPPRMSAHRLIGGSGSSDHFLGTTEVK